MDHRRSLGELSIACGLLGCYFVWRVVDQMDRPTASGGTPDTWHVRPPILASVFDVVGKRGDLKGPASQEHGR